LTTHLWLMRARPQSCRASSYNKENGRGSAVQSHHARRVPSRQDHPFFSPAKSTPDLGAALRQRLSCAPRSRDWAAAAGLIREQTRRRGEPGWRAEQLSCRLAASAARQPMADDPGVSALCSRAARHNTVQRSGVCERRAAWARSASHAPPHHTHTDSRGRGSRAACPSQARMLQAAPQARSPQRALQTPSTAAPQRLVCQGTCAHSDCEGALQAGNVHTSAPHK